MFVWPNSLLVRRVQASSELRPCMLPGHQVLPHKLAKWSRTKQFPTLLGILRKPRSTWQPLALQHPNHPSHSSAEWNTSQTSCWTLIWGLTDADCKSKPRCGNNTQTDREQLPTLCGREKGFQGTPHTVQTAKISIDKPTLLYISHFLEVIKVTNTTSTSVISALKSVTTRFRRSLLVIMVHSTHPRSLQIFSREEQLPSYHQQPSLSTKQWLCKKQYSQKNSWRIPT